MIQIDLQPPCRDGAQGSPDDASRTSARPPPQGLGALASDQETPTSIADHNVVSGPLLASRVLYVRTKSSPCRRGDSSRRHFEVECTRPKRQGPISCRFLHSSSLDCPCFSP